MTLKVADFWPAGTATDEGTLAATFPLLNEMEAPAGPAGPLRSTVPVDELPPKTLVGLRVSELSVAAVMVRVAEAFCDPRLA